MELTKYGTDPKRQDSAFYTYGDGAVVWERDDNPFYVRCVGEMRIHAVPEGAEGYHEVLRYTDRLEDFGITNDEQLAEWTAKGEEVFSWVNNSWFEVYHETDADFFSDPFHELDEAVAFAEMANKNPEEFGVVS
jgi:hypothetical protein